MHTYTLPGQYTVALGATAGGQTIVRSRPDFIWAIRDDDTGGRGDGMDDVWESTFVPPFSGLPDRDDDGDGKSNFDEFVSGTNPTDPASVLAVEGLEVETGATIKLSWVAEGGVEYAIQAADTLNPGGGWAELATVTVVCQCRVQIRLPDPFDRAGFYRLEARR